MTLQEQTELTKAIATASAAYQAAAAVLRLLPASVRWADKVAAREYLDTLREAESAAWRRYLTAVQISHQQSAAAYEVKYIAQAA
jgi:hypothetical protein